MKPVLVPTSDVNSDVGVVTHWHADDGAAVRSGDLVVEVETSKAVIDVVAPEDGLLLRGPAVGEEVRLGEAVAFLFGDEVALLRYRSKREAAAGLREGGSSAGPAATRPAQALAVEHGIDLASLRKSGLITARDVEAAIAFNGRPTTSELPRPRPVEAGVQRLLLVGAGLGATQVLDILAADPTRAAVAVVDDDRSRWSDSVGGVPVVGATDRVAELASQRDIDAAVITISTSVPARRRFRELLGGLGVPLVNVIDPTARIASEVQIGSGNVICAFCHFGVGTVVGGNNFLSAYNSFDHHSQLGSDICTGPGCMASGLVTIGDRVRMGTGIFIEPHVAIGADVQVASGSVLVTSVPASHAVKRRTGQLVVTPLRRRP